ncbi:MAG: hypothetical protein WCN88_04825 [Candidatus Falkowbacteria bacterium]
MFTNEIKNSNITAINELKGSTSFDNGNGYLLKEDTFYLLLETGDKIILEDSVGSKSPTVFVNEIK